MTGGYAAARYDFTSLMGPNNEYAFTALALTVSNYLAALDQSSSARPTSADLDAFAGHVRRRVELRVAEAELQQLTQFAPAVHFEAEHLVTPVDQLAGCVRAYLNALARERDVIRLYQMDLRPLEDLEDEVTNRVLWERDLRLLMGSLRSREQPQSDAVRLPVGGSLGSGET